MKKTIFLICTLMLNFAPDISAMDQQSPKDGNEHVAMANVARMALPAEDRNAIAALKANLIVSLDEKLKQSLAVYNQGSMSRLQMDELRWMLPRAMIFREWRIGPHRSDIFCDFLRGVEEIAKDRGSDVREWFETYPEIITESLQYRLHLLNMINNSDVFRKISTSNEQIMQQNLIQNAERCIMVFEELSYNPVFVSAISKALGPISNELYVKQEFICRVMSHFTPNVNDMLFVDWTIADRFMQFFDIWISNIAPCSHFALSEYIENGWNGIQNGNVPNLLTMHLGVLNKCEEVGVLQQGVAFITNPDTQLFFGPYDGKDFNSSTENFLVWSLVVLKNSGQDDMINRIIGQRKLNVLRYACLMFTGGKNDSSVLITLKIIDSSRHENDAFASLEAFFRIGANSKRDVIRNNQKIAGVIVEPFFLLGGDMPCINHCLYRICGPLTEEERAALDYLMRIAEEAVASPNLDFFTLICCRDAFIEIQYYGYPVDVLKKFLFKKMILDYDSILFSHF